jgi:hypothetical protein
MYCHLEMSPLGDLSRQTRVSPTNLLKTNAKGTLFEQQQVLVFKEKEASSQSSIAAILFFYKSTLVALVRWKTNRLSGCPGEPNSVR